MNNFIVIDDVLDSIRSSDRVSVIKQNVIDVIWQMTKKSRDLRNMDTLYDVLE